MTATFIQVGLTAPPPATPITDRTFLAWFDPDKNLPAVDKLAEGVARFIQKFNAAPTVVLCNIVDAEELRAAGVDLDVRDVLFLGTRGNFYLGRG